MDSEIHPRGLECAGTSLGYVSFRQNVWACRSFCYPLPQFQCALSGLGSRLTLPAQTVDATLKSDPLALKTKTKLLHGVRAAKRLP